MTCEPCTYLPEPVAGCSPTSSSDTLQLSLLSGNPTPAKSCGSAPQKDGSPACTCTREMSGCSIHPTTPEAWTQSMQAFLARICQSLEIRQDSAKEQEAAFTAKCCESLAWYDPATCSWKTYQQSFLEGWEPYSETWPRAGMTVAGVAWKHRESERRIGVIGGGCSQQWPTSTVCGNHNRKGASAKSGDGLATAVANSVAMNSTLRNSEFTGVQTVKAKGLTVPTPSSNDWKGSSKDGQRRGQLTDPAMGAIPDGGKLNPVWVEWLMAWPLEWTALSASGMAKCLFKQPSRGKFSVGQ